MATETPLVSLLAEQSPERLAELKGKVERQLAAARERVALLEFEAEQLTEALNRKAGSRDGR